MTHEELLAKIKAVIELTDDYDHYLKGAPINWDTPLAGLVALLRVVELHKPWEGKSQAIAADGTKYEKVQLCCSGDHPSVTYYPCPTIQAVEKELK